MDLQLEVYYLNKQLHPILDEEEEDPEMLVEDDGWEIIYVRFILLFMKNGRSCKSRDEISIRGRGCNTPVLSLHHALAFV